MDIRPDDPRLTPVHLRRDLIRRGYDDRAIRRALRAGELHRVRRGAYVDGQAWPDLDDAARHAVLARAAERNSKTAMVLSHVSALVFYDVPTWQLDLTAAHLTRLDGCAGRKEAGIVQHRGTICPGDVVELGDLCLMSPARAALELTTLVKPEPALVVVNDLLHRRALTPEVLRARYADGIHRWPATLTANVVMRLADPRIESVGETRTYFLCWQGGLPLPVPQYPVRDGNGRELWRLDFAWPDLGVWLEFDGKVKYSQLGRPGETPADVVVREKKREEAIARTTGWICVRITWDELANPALVLRRIRDAFARRAVARP